MKTIEEIVIKNIINLRKKNGLKQSDVAEKISYTNKAISRWEKGEVIPSLKVLGELATFYNVPFTYFFEEHEDQETQKRTTIANNMYIAITLSTTLVVWTIATLIFLTIRTYTGQEYPKIFIWAVPTSACVIDFCLKRWFKSKYTLITKTIILWTTIASIYFQLYHLNMWTIYLLGIPAQTSIVLTYVVKKIKEQRPKSTIKK